MRKRQDDLPWPRRRLTMCSCSLGMLDRSGKGWTVYALFALLSLAGTTATLCAIMDYRAGEFSALLTGIAGSLVLLFVVLGSSLVIRNKKDVPFVFLVVATPVLTGFCLLMLPGAVPDEAWHIYRVLNFELSGNGNMIVPDSLTYGMMPTTYESLRQAITLPADYASFHVVERDMSTYLSHLYLLPGMVSLVGEALNANPLGVVYAARLFNVVLYLIAGFWILRILPIGKTLAAVYLLNPMLMQQQASCSADAFVNISALMFLAYLLKLRFSDKVALHQWVLLGVLAVVMSISKYAYAPLVLLFLLFVPRIGSKRIRRAIYGSTIGLMVFVFVFMVFVYSGQAFRPSLDLLRDPAECGEILLRTYYQTGPFLVKSFAGIDLGALNISVWEPCLWLYGGLLFSALFNNLGEKNGFTRQEKALVLVLSGVLIILLTLIFREWSINVDRSYDVILGVQGRYFIPVIILPLLCAINPKATLVRPNCLIVYSAVLMIIYVFDFAAVVRFFW